MGDSEERFHRKEIARAQLKTAVSLFLNNMDLSSVITLAGAASNILSQLVRNVGKKPFIDYACDVYNSFNGSTPPRKKYNHHIDKQLGVSAHKHMSNNCLETISLDLEECAVYALIRAIADYVTLYGQSENFVKAFLSWSWKNQGHEVMKACENMPEKLKKMMRGKSDKKKS